MGICIHEDYATPMSAAIRVAGFRQVRELYLRSSVITGATLATPPATRPSGSASMATPGVSAPHRWRSISSTATSEKIPGAFDTAASSAASHCDPTGDPPDRPTSTATLCGITGDCRRHRRLRVGCPEAPLAIFGITGDSQPKQCPNPIVSQSAPFVAIPDSRYRPTGTVLE